jgi:hypothetical protein
MRADMMLVADLMRSEGMRRGVSEKFEVEEAPRMTEAQEAAELVYYEKLERQYGEEERAYFAALQEEAEEEADPEPDKYDSEMAQERWDVEVDRMAPYDRPYEIED